MKKILALCAFTMLFAAQSFATYVVVLKDGTRYSAKAKWTVVNGKAIVQLENGQSLQLDPALIDVARSEQATRMGLSNASVLDLNATAPPKARAPEPSLGSQIKLRPRTPAKPAQAPPTSPTNASATPTVAPISGAGTIPNAVIDKFQRAYENVGIFEQSVTSSGARSIRAELTVDTEERVFNIISASSFLMVRNAGVEGVQIEMVELFMKTTTGGSAGRFQMTRADAEALDKKSVSQQDYFIRNVIY